MVVSWWIVAFLPSVLYSNNEHYLLKTCHFDECLREQHWPQFVLHGGCRQKETLILIKRERVIHNQLTPATLQAQHSKDHVIIWRKAQT